MRMKKIVAALMAITLEIITIVCTIIPIMYLTEYGMRLPIAVVIFIAGTLVAVLIVFQIFGWSVQVR